MEVAKNQQLSCDKVELDNRFFRTVLIESDALIS
jgi:hypothetical protein